MRSQSSYEVYIGMYDVLSKLHAYFQIPKGLCWDPLSSIRSRDIRVCSDFFPTFLKAVVTRHSQALTECVVLQKSLSIVGHIERLVLARWKEVGG